MNNEIVNENLAAESWAKSMAEANAAAMERDRASERANKAHEAAQRYAKTLTDATSCGQERFIQTACGLIRVSSKHVHFLTVEMSYKRDP